MKKSIFDFNDLAQNDSSPPGAVLYERVSDPHQAAAGGSIAEQHNNNVRICERYGIEILATFVEPGGSGYHNEERKQFVEAVNFAIQHPQVKYFVVDDRTRFSRDPWVDLSTQRKLERAGVQIVSSANPVVLQGNRVAKAMSEGFERTIAHVKSVQLSSDTLRGMRGLILDPERRDPQTGWGFVLGGIPPWGYQSVKRIYGVVNGRDVTHSLWLLDETMLDGIPLWQIRQTAYLDWYLKEGLGYNSIANRLNAMGARTQKGNLFQDHTIFAWFEKRQLVYCTGAYLWNEVGRKTLHGHKKPTEQSAEDRLLIVKNHHPAILTEEEAETLFAMRADRKRTYGKGGHFAMRESRWLLGGNLFQCACGSSMYSTTGAGKDYYKCARHLKFNGEGCEYPSWSVRREIIDKAILVAIGKVYSRKEVESAVKLVQKRLEAEHTRQAPLLTEIADKLPEVKKLIESGALASDARAQLEQLVERLEESTSMAPRKIDVSAEVEKFQSALVAALEDAEPARLVKLKALIRCVCNRVVANSRNQSIFVHLTLPEFSLEHSYPGRDSNP